MFLIVPVLILFIDVTTMAVAECDRDTGPTGVTECLYLKPNCTDYQWATCLTTDYIKIVSNGKHVCTDETASYCWAQCMMEEFDIDHGDVFPEYACSPWALQTTKMVTDIPNWCLSPDGRNCGFFRNCLQWRYPCNDSGYSYMLGLEENICKLYENHARMFTTTGQQWLNAVRKCLQANLVPFLRPYEHPTCDDITQSACLSHRECYANPSYNAPSICDISFRDWFQVVATVKYALDWEMWKRCDLQRNGDTFSEGLEMFLDCQIDSSEITILEIAFSTNVRTSVINSVISVAFQIECFLKSRYDTDDLLIYPLIFDSTEYIGTTHIVIAQRSEFDLNFQQGKYIDIDEAVNDLLDKMSSSKFLPKLPDRVEIESYFMCDESSCLNPNSF